jgi:pimeloyl-ACP methyl ester carboxylesterase
VESRGVPEGLAPGFAPAVGTVRVADGRKIAYRTYGPADGRPVLLFHGGIGASLLPPGTEAACHELGLRIVAPERAGVGHSDGLARHSLEAVAQDMAAFAIELNLSPVQYLAINSGGQAALATAAQAPDTVSRILMLSPRPPSTAHARSPNRMVVLQKRLQDHPWMAEAYFAIVKHRFTRPLMRQIMVASAVSKGDGAFLAKHPQIVDTIALGVQAALKRGAQGTAAEITTPPSKDELAALGRTAPVTVWLGAEDDYATPDEVTDWMGDRIETLTVIDGIGHYLTLKHWTEALAWLSGANRG